MKSGSNIIELKVEGMDCANCAQSITRFLERKGLKEVYVNFQTKEVRYQADADQPGEEEVKAGINKLGYQIVEKNDKPSWWTLERKLLISAIFTLPLLIGHLSMMVGLDSGLMYNYRAQLLLALTPVAIGILHFGRSALSSIRGGVPNMDVLIFIGGTAAFIYSLIGLVQGNGDYIFFETAATIFTLVLLGNWFERRAVKQTTTAIEALTALQVETAKKIMPSGALVRLEVNELKKGDLLQINQGDKIPTDGRVRSGRALVDESMLTGESEPVEKEAGEEVYGATLLQSGNLQVEVTALGRQSVLGQMIELVKTAQQDKPDIQRLADQISAVFVPVVLTIALLTFFLGHFAFGVSTQKALMNAIAVLVISCPCAMGLATPTAVMVGVGRLARKGILIRGGQTVELLARIKNMVFDKTGTLTSGQLQLAGIDYFSQEKSKVNKLILELEKHSSHPIARALMQEMAAAQNGYELRLASVTEIPGEGLKGVDLQQNEYRLGSARVLPEGWEPTDHQIYLVENKEVLAGIKLQDDLREDAADLIEYLDQQGVKSILLSGDQRPKVAAMARKLGMEEYYAEQLPTDKLDRLDRLSAQAPTAMVGDGINDAPALAKATVGISLSNATQVAIQSAKVVLLNGRLGSLRAALAISKATVITIRQNLFWAFAYNVVAIPIAALGFLNPMWGAIFMAFSDLVVIGNSVRLRFRRIQGE